MKNVESATATWHTPCMQVRCILKGKFASLTHGFHYLPDDTILSWIRAHLCAWCIYLSLHAKTLTSHQERLRNVCRANGFEGGWGSRYTDQWGSRTVGENHWGQRGKSATRWGNMSCVSPSLCLPNYDPSYIYIYLCKSTTSYIYIYNYIYIYMQPRWASLAEESESWTLPSRKWLKPVRPMEMASHWWQLWRNSTWIFSYCLKGKASPIYLAWNCWNTSLSRTTRSGCATHIFVMFLWLPLRKRKVLWMPMTGCIQSSQCSHLWGILCSMSGTLFSRH